MAAKMTLDFSQVKDGGAFSPKHKEEGEYLGTFVSFEDTKSKNNNPMWVFGIQLKDDRRAVYPVYCVLNPDSLWKLRQVLLAAGFKVPKKRLTIDGNRLVGKDVGIFLEDDEYEGKKKSVISSFFPAEEYSGPDAGDSSDDDEDDEEEELPEEDEVEEEADEENNDDSDATDGSDDDGDDEASDDTEDEEDEEPAPAPAKTKKAKAKKPEPEDEDDDEMDVDEL